MCRAHFVLLDVIEEHKHSVVSWINTTTACHPFVLFYAWGLLGSTWNNKRELGRVLSFGIDAEHSIYKYWNWCRCIQRKDSARVILTASWFNNINIGYRFHTSTVCHSCCNNVMYVVVLKLYIQGKSCVRSMQASAARLRPGSGILFMTYIDICIISVW